MEGVTKEYYPDSSSEGEVEDYFLLGMATKKAEQLTADNEKLQKEKEITDNLLQETKKQGYQEAVAEYQPKLDAKDKDNQQLSEKLKINKKTQLPNEEALKDFIEIFDSRQPYGVIATYIDLKNFGELNRKYGHTATDKKLFEFGQNLNQKKRKTDFLFHLHGDEFVLVSIVTPPIEEGVVPEDGLKKHLEDINNSLETKFDSISITFDKTKHTSLRDAVNEADETLMKIKDIRKQEISQQNRPTTSSINGNE